MTDPYNRTNLDGSATIRDTNGVNYGSSTTDGSGSTGGSNWMGLAGLGGLLVGSGLGYLGERRGANAMLSEADRQAEEQRQFSLTRRAKLMEALGRYDPNALPVQAGVQTNRRMDAARPALSAGGAALGLSGSQVGNVGQALGVAQRVAGQRDAQGLQDVKEELNLRRLGIDTRGVDEASQLASGTYHQRLGYAGQQGAGLRLGGDMLGSAGIPLMALAMNRRATPASVPAPASV